VAKVQVVIVPVGITAKTSDADRTKLYDEIRGLAQRLKDARVRVYFDQREGYSPGYKFNDHELKGVPLRLEFGPRDSTAGVVVTSRRDRDGKGSINLEHIETAVPDLLETIQKDLFERASEAYASRRKIVQEWKDFVPTLHQKNALIVPHCLGGECEDQIKKDSAGNLDSQEVDARAPSMGAKSLCIPLEQPESFHSGTLCINPKCGQEAKTWVMFGRSY
jgi:prolyl-tRNA synthetase